MLKLYHAPTSVCSQKVRVGMAHMGLGYEGVVLDLQAGDQFKPEYRALNPDAVVPTLVDDGLVLVESSLILAYLDREHNGGRLMPEGRAERAGAEHWLLRCLALHAAINTLSFATAMGPKIRAATTDAEIDALAASFPDPIMGAKRRDLILNGLDSPYVGQAMLHLRRLVADMQTALAHASWMNGSAIGITDIALVAYVDRLDRLGLSALWEAEAPRIGTWLNEWKDTSAYATGIAAHVPEGTAGPMREAGQMHWTKIETAWTAAA